jgi:hypothetical protein
MTIPKHADNLNRTDKKREAFRRLAAQRTNAAMERLRILGNCANRQLYEYSDDEVQRIFRVIEKEVRAVKAKFLNSRRPDFSL